MKNLDYIAVGKRIKKIRKQKNYTQEKVAEIADLSTKYISEIELGKKEGRLDTYFRIALALDVSVDEFLKDSVPSNTVAFERNFNTLYKNFGKIRREMLLDFMSFLDSKKDYDLIDKDS